MASRASRAAARQKKLKESVNTVEIECVDESPHIKAELTASVSSEISHMEKRNRSSRKKVGTPLVRKLQENSVRNLRGKKKGKDDDSANEEIEEIKDEESDIPKIQDELCTEEKKKIVRKGSCQQQNLSGTTCDQRDDDSDACSIEEIDCENELLEKDSKQRVLKEILEMADAKERDDDAEIITLDEEESICTTKSTVSIIDIDGEEELIEEDVVEKEVQNVDEDEEPLWFDIEQESTPSSPNKESDDEELEVLFSKISERESSVERKCLLPSTLADNEEKNLTKDSTIETCEKLPQDIQVKNDNDDNEISCEKDSQLLSHISAFKINDGASSGRPWAVSAKEWVAKPVVNINKSEKEDDVKNIENLIDQENTGNDLLVKQKEKSVSKEVCLKSMQVRADVHQKDQYLDNDDKQNISVAEGNNDSETDDTNIGEELSLHPDEEDLLMDTTTAVGTDVNIDDARTDEKIVDAATEENITDAETDENTVDSQDENIDDSNDHDFIEETAANIDENSDCMVHEDIPNVLKHQGLYYPDNFQYRVENFDGMVEDEYHRIIVADDGVFSPKPNNRFAVTLVTVDKGGLDFVGIALRETLKNLASEKPEKLFLIRFVCGLCNIVYKYKYNQSNGSNIPCCGDCCLWSVRGDFENFYEDYNKLWKSIQSEFPEAVFIPTALPSINVKNISIFNQHEYCCPHIPTHFSISGQVVDNMQSLFNKSMKFINPALNNLCFEMGFQRIYWTKERNRSRWKALMKAMQSDSAVARNLQVQKKFTPGDSEANVDPEKIVSIDGDLVNEESEEAATTLPTGFSQDNLQSSSTPSNDDPNSTAADNSKTQTQGDSLSQQQEKIAVRFDDVLSEEAKKARAARFGIEPAAKTIGSDNVSNLDTTTGSNMKDEELSVSTTLHNTQSQDTEKYNTAVALKRVREIMAMASSKQNESSDQQQEGTQPSEDSQNEQDVNKDGTENTNQESDGAGSGSPKRSWINNNNNKTGNLKDNGNNWKGNMSWKQKNPYNKPWNNNPLWRNNNHNYNNKQHYDNNKSWNNSSANNKSWSNNRPWQKQWNGSSSWNNHSYNTNNYNRSYGNNRGNWNNNQNNKRKWNENRNNNSYSNAKHSKIEISTSSSSNKVQPEVKEDNTQGQNLASTSTFNGTTNTASDSQQQHLASTSKQSQNVSSVGPPTSNQATAPMSRGPEENVRIKEEQSPGDFQRIVRIKREPGNVECWPGDSPMFTIKRGPIDDFRPLKDELKNEKSV